MVIDSNYHPFVKPMGGVLRLGLQPLSKGMEESFAFVVAEPLIHI